MNEQNKISLYFNGDDPEGALAFSVLSQLGHRKSRVVARLIASLAKEYNDKDVEDMTLREISAVKTAILADLGLEEAPPTAKKPKTREKAPKRPSEPRKAPDVKSIGATPEKPTESVPESRFSEEAPKVQKEPRKADSEPPRDPAPADVGTDVGEEGGEKPYLNEELMSQLGAFYGN